ncbi:hypothetical protein ABT167_05390 [Streptomyces sp. NPDC001792]|uniref:hypothetical protein n=1 Tax=Streptomyces sp. NPDC001792 TaxID=3154524 RepID=UPI00332C3FB7
MHTLRNITEQIALLPASSAEATGWPKSFRPKGKIYVPGESALVMPGDLAGLARVDGPGNVDACLPDITAAEARTARALLLGSPSFVLPLERPSTDELVELGCDPAKFRSERARALCLSVCVKLPSGVLLFGAARVVALENGIRMGSTLLLQNEDQWSRTLDEVEDRIISYLPRVAAGVHPRPEPNGKPWKKVVALLGAPHGEESVPPTWKNQLKLTAGLREIDLDIRVSPESARSVVIADLRSNPPSALLVWADWVAHPQVFIQPFVAARPGAKADILGSPDKSLTFEENVAELAMHLREVSPILEEGSSESEDRKSWSEVAERILALAGPHFLLTQRAIKMLADNPYPKPSRMLNHVESLARIAMDYHQMRGDLGGRLSEYAMDKEGIEIALTDSTINPPVIESVTVYGESVQAIPHVKVDDFKASIECGRIYFALDRERFRFIVDHIGLHDYG